MKKLTKTVLALVLTLAVVLTTACGSKNSSTQDGNDDNSSNQTSSAGDVVTIGVTDTIASLNPLLQDGTEVMKYATSLVFLPLVELNEDLAFVPQVASKITTEDNRTFTIQLNQDIKWSDGEAITSEDVLFTFLLWASPEVGNSGMSIYQIEGVGDDGYIEAGADSISGVVAVDEYTVQITTKYEMALQSFENIYGRYILILPEHALKDIPFDELLTTSWFNAPDVVSGPYNISDFDLNHYVTYTANDNYYYGAPKIKHLNIKVVTSSQLLTGLSSGELDLVQQTTGNILQEDYASVEALTNVNLYDGTPVTNQSVFFNTERVTDARIRQAFAYGIDRETLLNELLDGRGEIVDAFLVSASPYYSSELTPIAYDTEKAQELLTQAEADGWDPSTVYQFYINSGDTVFVQAATYIAAKLGEIGLNIQINTVDLATLMSTANSGDFDIMAVQYTYTPVDPYTDMAWLLSEYGWTKYINSDVDAALAQTQQTSDLNEAIAGYLAVDKIVQEQVPMYSAYVISSLGVTNKRLQNAVPDVFGTFINVHEWEIVE